MDVGVRELKAKLAEYLDRAQRGEQIRVTSRGRPKAMLVAVRDSHPDETPLERGLRDGWLTPPVRRDRRPPPPRMQVERTIQQLMDEDRGA